MASERATEDVAAADAAAALLRDWGVKAVRRGPNALGSLTTREREILALTNVVRIRTTLDS